MFFFDDDDDLKIPIVRVRDVVHSENQNCVYALE